MTDHQSGKSIKTMVPNLIRLISPFKIKNAMNAPGTTNPTAIIRHSLLIARFLLISLTSVFYLIGPPESPLGIKMLVVAAMMVAVFITQDIYRSKEIEDILSYLYNPNKIVLQQNKEYQDHEKLYYLLILISIETMGTALLTLPTGGLDSPFAWYALNPIITAAFYLSFYYSWVTMGSFLSAVLLFRHIQLGITTSLIPELLTHMSLIMVFCLCTALAQVASALYKKLARAYSQLQSAHKESEDALAHTASLYQALEACSAGEDRVQIADILAGYASKLCQKPAGCLIMKESGVPEGDGDAVNLLRIAGKPNPLEYDVWEREMNQLWNRAEPDMSRVLHCDVDVGYRLICRKIISHSECFGMLAYLDAGEQNEKHADRIKSLSFLAGLGGITLERLKADNLYGRLLVSEEQNRIANEIHDGVAQYLFSMVCAVHTLSQQDMGLQDNRVQEQLKLVEDTANRASRELKASIYGLSPHKRGESIFVETIASYLDDLGRLHGIQVDLQAEGSEEVISPALRKALYRMVREASSNALRHGKCSALKVTLCMYPNRTVLEVKDNGTGWRFKDIRMDEKAGLGLRNMMQAAELFGGQIDVDSRYGKGTTIRCIVPKAAPEHNKEGINYEIGTY